MNPAQHTVNPALYRPVLFFVWSLLLPWAAWLAAAYLSHQPDGGHNGLLTALLLAGLLAPMCLAAALLWRQPALRADALLRLRLSGVRKRYWLAAVLLPPLSLVLAQGVLLLFGYPAAQFQISGSPSLPFGLLFFYAAFTCIAVFYDKSMQKLRAAVLKEVRRKRRCKDYAQAAVFLKPRGGSIFR